MHRVFGLTHKSAQAESTVHMLNFSSLLAYAVFMPLCSNSVFKRAIKPNTEWLK